MIEFDVEKSRQKNWTPLWNAIYYALLKKTVNIEDYTFEKKSDEVEVSSNFRKNDSKCKTDPQNWEKRLKIEKQKKIGI